MARFTAILVLIGAFFGTPLQAKPDRQRACELAKWELEVFFIRGCDLATCQVARQSGPRTFEVSMECPAAPNGDRGRLKQMISFDPTPQLSPFQRDFLRVMQCEDGGQGPRTLSELLKSSSKFKDGEPYLYGVTVGGVYFHKAQLSGGEDVNYFMLTAEPDATVEEVRAALGWRQPSTSVAGAVRKIREGKSGVEAICTYNDPNERKVVAPSGLVMRELPSQSAKQSRMQGASPDLPVLIPNGSVVTLVGCKKGPSETISGKTGTWCEVTYSPMLGVGAQGWVFGGFLEAIEP